MIEVQLNGTSRPQQYHSEEDFIFSFHTLTARWNNLVEIAPVCKWKAISLYAMTPLEFDEQWRPVKDRYKDYFFYFKSGFQILNFACSRKTVHPPTL